MDFPKRKIRLRTAADGAPGEGLGENDCVFSC